MDLPENEIWSIGGEIAARRSLNLHGGADIKASHATLPPLSVVPDPAPDNPNHANIIGWPDEKDARKSLALELAKNACFFANPDT